jgi:hypothetical protein
MKTTTGMMTLAALLGTTSGAFAAASAPRDGCLLAIYVFLGMCAMIIVVQLFPMLLMLYGLVMGLTHGKHETAVKEEVVVDK